MTRKFDKKQNGENDKRRKPVALMAVEGWNVTESKYFQYFQTLNIRYTIKILRTKSLTDPKGMLDELKKKWKSMELKEDSGDVAFLITDLDCDKEKANIIKNLIQKNPDVCFVVSNPCFEIWFLLHFKYSTKGYVNGDALIKELKKYIPDYQKNIDVSQFVKDKTDTAIQNAEKLEKHFEDMGYKWPGVECNPRTDLNIIFETIKKKICNSGKN